MKPQSWTACWVMIDLLTGLQRRICSSARGLYDVINYSDISATNLHEYVKNVHFTHVQIVNIFKNSNIPILKTCWMP